MGSVTHPARHVNDFLRLGKFFLGKRKGGGGEGGGRERGLANCRQPSPFAMPEHGLQVRRSGNDAEDGTCRRACQRFFALRQNFFRGRKGAWPIAGSQAPPSRVEAWASRPLEAGNDADNGTSQMACQLFFRGGEKFQRRKGAWPMPAAKPLRPCNDTVFTSPPKRVTKQRLSHHRCEVNRLNPRACRMHLRMLASSSSGSLGVTKPSGVLIRSNLHRATV